MSIHNAIYKLNPTVKMIRGEDAFDDDGNPVAYDKDAAQAESLRMIATENRRAAYIAEADPLFFKAQRGEATMEEWQAKVAEIKTRFPKD
jgi:hypothetical protein